MKRAGPPNPSAAFVPADSAEIQPEPFRPADVAVKIPGDPAG